MRWVRTIASEVFGLFVDDGRFAVAILAWLLVVGLASTRLHLGSVWSALALFAGLAAIFIESAARGARRKKNFSMQASRS